jgi:hypothetical protein
MALQYVYDESYGFQCTLEQKRNQFEIQMNPTKDGQVYNPKFSVGFGVLDVCSFALRIACWSINVNQTSPILFYDEPFRNIHGKNENMKAAQMVKALSNMLGIQIIIISGENELSNYADTIYEVKLSGGESHIELIGERNARL